MRDVGTLAAVGAHLVACTFIGLFLGRWLDGLLGTAPVLLFVLLIAGIVAGFLNAVRVSRRLGR